MLADRRSRPVRSLAGPGPGRPVSVCLCPTVPDMVCGCCMLLIPKLTVEFSGNGLENIQVRRGQVRFPPLVESNFSGCVEPHVLAADVLHGPAGSRTGAVV